MKPLTDKQRDVFSFIAAFRDKHGFAPTYENIGNHFGITKHGAFCHVQALEKKGYVAITRIIARGIVVKGETDGVSSVSGSVGNKPGESLKGADQAADTCRP